MSGLLEIFDPKAPPRAIGIDLGTTNSLVAFVKNDRPEAIRDCDGLALVPSVVHYGPAGDVVVICQPALMIFSTTTTKGPPRGRSLRFRRLNRCRGA